MVKTDTYVKNVCFVSIFIGITGAILPSGKMKGAFSSFCAVVLIFYMVSPIADIRTDGLKKFDFEKGSNDELLLSDVRTAELMLCEQMLENVVEDKLRQSITDVSVRIFCEKQSDEIRVVSAEVEGCTTEEERIIVRNFLADSFDGIKVSFEEESDG